MTGLWRIFIRVVFRPLTTSETLNSQTEKNSRKQSVGDAQRQESREDRNREAKRNVLFGVIRIGIRRRLRARVLLVAVAVGRRGRRAGLGSVSGRELLRSPERPQTRAALIAGLHGLRAHGAGGKRSRRSPAQKTEVRM